MTNSENTSKAPLTLANIGVDVNISALSAVYLALALSIPIVVYFIFNKL